MRLERAEVRDRDVGAAHRIVRPAQRTGCSAATQRMHDFHPVAVGDRMRVVAAARHDLAVDLDRDAAAGKALVGEQLGDRAIAFEGEILAIESDMHDAIVAAPRRRRTRAAVQRAGFRACV